MWEGRAHRPSRCLDSNQITSILPCNTTRGVEGPCKNMFSVTKAAVWFKSPLWASSLCCSWKHSYVSAARMGASSGFDFFPYHNSKCQLHCNHSPIQKPTRHHGKSSPTCSMKDRTNFFFLSIKPNPKKTMLSEMITYLVTKLWVSLTQMSFSTILPITDICIFTIK